MKLIIIAGPVGSGTLQFSKKLALELTDLGYKVFVEADSSLSFNERCHTLSDAITKYKDFDFVIVNPESFLSCYVPAGTNIFYACEFSWLTTRFERLFRDKYHMLRILNKL